jgi:hypothetical protein
MCWYAHEDPYVPHETIVERMVGSTSSASNVHWVVNHNSYPCRNIVMDMIRMNQGHVDQCPIIDEEINELRPGFLIFWKISTNYYGMVAKITVNHYQKFNKYQQHCQYNVFVGILRWYLLTRFFSSLKPSVYTNKNIPSIYTKGITDGKIFKKQSSAMMWKFLWMILPDGITMGFKLGCSYSDVSTLSNRMADEFTNRNNLLVIVNIWPDHQPSPP